MEVSVEKLKKATNQGIDSDGIGLPAEAENTLAIEKPILKEITKDNVLPDSERLLERRERIEEKGVEPVDFAYERAIGRNDSLYTNFTELIALTKRKVCRIVIKEGGKKTGYATGFMVSRRLLLTNWHVFKTKEMAEESEAQFFYEYDAQGHPLSPVIFRFDTAGFFNDRVLDYCFVAVQPMDVTGKVSLENIGYLYLDKSLGKVGQVHIEKLNIIHHPQGEYKQMSIRENTFEGISKTKLFYLTDTAPGSSGSPVFNDQWQVVGLHHKSVARQNAAGDYLDQDGNIIPSVNGKVDASRIVWLKNEGIRISVILNHVARMNPTSDLIAAIAAAPPPENLTFTVNQANTVLAEKVETTMETHQGNDLSIHVPAGVLSSDRSIEISLSSKLLHSDAVPATIFSRSREIPDELVLELAKVDKEKQVDFSQCEGYDPNFLGVEIPLPQPMMAIRKQIARLRNKEIELKYFKYSVIFNAMTHMPLVSAINVEGDASKRLDNSKRNDDWLRDTRIDVECQLNDKFYSGSHFDKGHMSRFEDANWDNTESDALRNGIYTCFYTNACPQVPALNRQKGLWGRLEKAVLEKGVKKQSGKQARMTVFNGPIFNQGEKIFKGTLIPMDFFKIVVWLNDRDELRATGFRLTQKDDLGKIKFDENMAIDEEALDIDQDVRFKSLQCNIRRLSELTQIDFKHLEHFDTFTGNNDEECVIDDVESIVL